MTTTTRLMATAGCATLLLSGLTVLPAQAQAPAAVTAPTAKTTTKKITKKVTVKYKGVRVYTSKLFKGDKKLIRNGVNGKATKTYLVTTVDGKTTTKLVKTVVTKKPVTRKVYYGTNTKHKINLSKESKWRKIAKCESGLRWGINTGNGYFGGLQFNLGTWRSVGGKDYASYPHKATWREQITVANRLYKQRGFQPWGCKHVL